MCAKRLKQRQHRVQFFPDTNVNPQQILELRNSFLTARHFNVPKGIPPLKMHRLGHSSVTVVTLTASRRVQCMNICDDPSHCALYHHTHIVWLIYAQCLLASPFRAVLICTVLLVVQFIYSFISCFLFVLIWMVTVWNEPHPYTSPWKRINHRTAWRKSINRRAKAEKLQDEAANVDTRGMLCSLLQVWKFLKTTHKTFLFSHGILSQRVYFI